jgi:hypothetical protein
MIAATSASDFGLVVLLTVIVVAPIAAVMFARSGKSLEHLGKGPWAIDRDSDAHTHGRGDSALERRETEEEIRQMVIASDYRRRARGEDGIEIEEEVTRLLATRDTVSGPAGEVEHAEIRIEIRQLVVANNERRARRGEEPLDVETEVEKRIREWT